MIDKFSAPTPIFDDSDDHLIIGTVYVPTYVTAQTVADIVDAALSGDSQSWLRGIKVIREGKGHTTCMADKIADGGILELAVDPFLESHGNKPVEYILIADIVVKGLQAYVMEYNKPTYTADIDSSIADMILQFGLFGEVVFC